MKNSLPLLASSLVFLFTPFIQSTQAAQLIDIQFGGNDFNGNSPLSDPQTGAGLIGTAGDQWNNFTSSSALLSGVSLNDSTGVSTGATLTAAGSSNSIYYNGVYNSLYQYSVGAAGTATNNNNASAPNQLGGTPVGNLAQGELGADSGATLTLSFTGLTDNTAFSIYLYSSPDNWGRSSSWTVNGSPATTVGPLNSYSGPYASYYGAPYVLVEGINYIVLSGTSDDSGALTLAGLGLNSTQPDVNGLQILAVPEPSTFAMILGSLGVLTMFRRRRA